MVFTWLAFISFQRILTIVGIIALSAKYMIRHGKPRCIRRRRLQLYHHLQHCGGSKVQCKVARLTSRQYMHVHTRVCIVHHTPHLRASIHSENLG